MDLVECARMTGITEAKRHFSSYAREVARTGGVLIVLKNNRPYVKIVSAGRAAGGGESSWIGDDKQGEYGI